MNVIQPKLTSRKYGIVHNRLSIDTVTGDAIVELLLEGRATNKERDGAWPHNRVDRDDAEPDEDLVPFLHTQTENCKAEGCFGK